MCAAPQSMLQLMALGNLEDLNIFKGESIIQYSLFSLTFHFLFLREHPTSELLPFQTKFDIIKSY